MSKEGDKSPQEIVLSHARRLIAAEEIEDKFSKRFDEAFLDGDTTNPLYVFFGLQDEQSKLGAPLNIEDEFTKGLAVEAVRSFAKNIYTLKMARELKNKLSSWNNEVQPIPITNNMTQALMWGAVTKVFGDTSYQQFGGVFEGGIAEGQLALLENLQVKGLPLLLFPRNILCAATNTYDNPQGFKKPLGTKINGVEVQYEYIGRCDEPLVDLIVSPIS